MTTISPDPLAVVTERLDHLHDWLVVNGVTQPWQTGTRHQQVVISPGDGTRYAYVVAPPMLTETTPGDYADLSRKEGLLVGLRGTGGWGDSWVAVVGADRPVSLFDVQDALPAQAGPWAHVLTFALWSMLIDSDVDEVTTAITGYEAHGLTGPAIVARWTTFGG